MLFSDIFHEKVTEPGWILSLNDTGGTVLHSFAAVGDFYVVQLAFAARAEMIDCLDENGETVLHRCCETGHAEVAAFFLEKKKEDRPWIMARSNNGATALHLACCNGHLKVVKVLVEKCPECVDVVHEGLVPLHAASLNGHVDVAKYLLGVRPDQIDVKTDDEMTVLHLASQEGVLELVEYLADLCPALVEAKMPDATLAFHLACSEDHETTMTALLSRTKSETVVDSRSNGNRTFLHHVALQGSVALTTWLLDKHPSLLTCKDEHGNIALHMASSRGHLELVRLLLSKDSEQVHAGDNCGVTSLMASSLLGDLETAQLMLEHAKERKRELILARGSTGWSAAHGAAQSGCIAMVKCLFDACEESISLLNPNESTLTVAAEHGHVDVVEFLLDHVSNEVVFYRTEEFGRNCMHFAVQFGRADVFELLLSRFPDLLDVVEGRGWNMLHCAVSSGSLEITRSLLWWRPDMVLEHGPRECSVLRLAVCHPNPTAELVEALLDCIGDRFELLIQGDDQGVNAFHYACDKGLLNIVKLMVRREEVKTSLLCQATSNFGCTPLHLAVANEHSHVVEFLLEQGADVRLTDLEGNRPIDLSQRPEIVRMLTMKEREQPAFVFETPAFTAASDVFVPFFEPESNNFQTSFQAYKKKSPNRRNKK